MTRVPLPPLLPAALAVLLAAGACGGTRQVVTAPPVTAVAPDDAPTTERARVSVEFQSGATSLPPDVARLRFRVEEVWLKPADGAWTAYPAGAQIVVARSAVPTQKLLLTASVPPVAYDSLAVRLADVYVEFDANAGAPLTLARGDLLRLPFAFRPDVDAPTAVRLTFEPAASLSRLPSGRWLFAPFLTPAIGR